MNAPVKQQQLQPAGSALMAFESARLPITDKFAERLGVTAGQWRVLVDQIFPAAKSIEAITMALAYCKSRNLDIYKKPVHIVPMWSSALGRMVETVWPGIAEIRTTAARTGEYAGIDAVEFGPVVERPFSGTIEQWVEPEGGGRKVKQAVKVEKSVRFPEWASVVVYRIVAGQRCAYHAKVYWEETYATMGKSDIPNEMWSKRPRGQLDKCVEAAALRKAFPEELGNTYAAEEMEGRTIDHDISERRDTPPKPPAPPVPPSNVVDVDTEVVTDDPVTEGIDSDGDQPADDDLVDDNTFFEQLEEALAVASDAASIEEVWTQFDPMARFDGKPNGEVNQGIANAIRRRAEKRIGGGNGQA